LERDDVVYACGLIGKTLEYSVSPVIFRTFCEEAGVEGDYCRVELPTEEAFRDFVKCGLIEGPFVGFNVTIPYKEAAYALSNVHGSDAERTGAVNTLSIENGKLRGDNTDVFGFVRSAQEHLIDAARNVALVVGAGGAARAVLAALEELGFTRALVLNRSLERAVRMTKELAHRLKLPIETVADEAAVRELCEAGTLDVLVNATPVGMKGGAPGMPVSESILDLVSPHGLVVDLIYNPPETNLLRNARRRSIKNLNGVGMLVWQAARSFEIWTGILPDTKRALQRVNEVLA
jgi:shikimate dehydrogenase